MLSYDNCGLGLQEEEAANIYVYPNPAKSEITLLGIDGEYNYQLVELTGKVVLSGSAQGKKTLQVDLLVSGMYIVTIDGESVRYRSTLVIE